MSLTSFGKKGNEYDISYSFSSFFIKIWKFLWLTATEIVTLCWLIVENSTKDSAQNNRYNSIPQSYKIIIFHDSLFQETNCPLF